MECGMAFPECIDNTIRSSAAVCQTQAKYAYIEDLSGPGDSVHLHFGGAMAHGLEHARRAYHDGGLSARDAVDVGVEHAMAYYGEYDPPHKSPKTLQNVGNAIRYYFTIWPLDSDPVQPMRLPDGSLGVEWRFKVPIPDLTHPDTGGPVYYVGRTDQLATLSGLGIIEDDKTASQLGASWGQQFRLDSQGIGYAWAGQQEGLFPKDAPVSVLFRGVGIYTPKYRKPGTETPVKKVTQDMIDSGAVEYDLLNSFGTAQEIVTHSPWVINRWLDQLKLDISRLIWSYENGKWNLALHKSACAAYGGCSFQSLCESQNPDQWKEINFVKRKWDPLAVI